MTEQEQYKEIYKKLWNQKTDAHVTSDFYANADFLNGETSLNPIELDLLGEVKDKKILHLQCHFGQDSLSLARLGAAVTGVDLSDRAIAKAQELNNHLGLDATFICSDVYETPHSLDGQFDLVFSSYGTIGWLPDLNKWAQVITRCLKPGGKLVFVEFHPIVWSFDYEFTKIAYSYFNKEAIIEEETGTYADREANIVAKSVSWNHPLSDVIQSLINNGMTVESFAEYDYSPYNCFLNTVEIAPKKFQIRGMEGKLPMLYSLTAKKIQSK
ncbi:class I SAM-dependent methyltransferase [Sphingobacterium lactis]|uniref:Ubiquinone/menaquinone biosynthesis C-methylase UbiE n=1 Tax=Sphingobacterium lactis TaxID=797291 RepID=A0A1H6BGJ8_9SPHI|nr:class I SAM-dependent methyltransferase [Sphingobacterium lactis]SEG59883.1 Ubiquinone/menaquinone biosynthesis C-methylase UbiE [Sphingobacterium lactis]